MARRFVVPVGLVALANNPAGTYAGETYFNTTTGTIRIYDGTDTWLDGTQGTTGAQGTTGIQGTVGAQGTTGLQGTTGAQGTTGSQGTTGTQGISGGTGYTAPTLGSTSIASGATVSTIAGLTLTSPVITSPKISSTYSAKTAAYTFASGDEGSLFSMNNAASVQFNIPTDATFNFAVGTEFNVFWITGAGQPTIGAVTPGTTTVRSTGATSATPKLRVANSGATIKKIAANSWIVFGDIA